MFSLIIVIIIFSLLLQINNPLYDAIVNNMQSPLANHTLQRTFKPSLEAWFGPDIK